MLPNTNDSGANESASHVRDQSFLSALCGLTLPFCGRGANTARGARKLNTQLNQCPFLPPLARRAASICAGKRDSGITNHEKRTLMACMPRAR
jgi:hypothetical protein